MRSLEIFGGCGGLALGLSRAGFSSKVVVELDPSAIETLQLNHRRGIDHYRQWEISPTDIRDFTLDQLDDLDLVSGGPPCQPFSIGGNHQGPLDHRNLWPEAFRVVHGCRPKAFLFENVRGLLRPAFADYLKLIHLQLCWPSLTNNKGDWQDQLRRLQKHDAANQNRREYEVVVKGLNAADYGAAQKRHRAIVMGVRTDVSTDWQFPNASHSQHALVWEKCVSGNYWRRHGLEPSGPLSARERQILSGFDAARAVPDQKPWVTVRDRLFDLPAPGSDGGDPNHYQHPGARAYRNHTGSLADEPAKALKAGAHGVPGGENMLVMPDGSVRYFTLREMARLQGLPDEAHITGTWRHVTRQLGNAVPAEVGCAFGRAIFDILSRAAPERIAA